MSISVTKLPFESFKVFEAFFAGQNDVEGWPERSLPADINKHKGFRSSELLLVTSLLIFGLRYPGSFFAVKPPWHLPKLPLCFLVMEMSLYLYGSRNFFHFPTLFYSIRKHEA